MHELHSMRLEKSDIESNVALPAKPTRFLSLRQVLDRTSISRSLVYQLIKDKERPFPAPIHIGRRSVWIEGEVEAYMNAIIGEERADNLSAHASRNQ